MKSKVIITAMLSFLIFAMTGCATMGTSGHKYFMRGQALEVTGSEAYICTGTAEGGKAWQEYTVHGFVKSMAAPQKQAPVFTRQIVGEVKIPEVVDEHYAKTRVLKGDVRVNDVVQLKG